MLLLTLSIFCSGLALILLLIAIISIRKISLKVIEQNEEIQKENIDLRNKVKELKWDRDFNKSLLKDSEKELRKKEEIIKRIKEEIQTNQFNSVVNLENKIKTILSSDQTK